jgi:16S rRNA (guanine(1405)-N(7))-methyltransferase
MTATLKDQLQELVRLVKLNETYASIDESVIAAIGMVELAKRGSLKEAVKTTRNKLHQIGSAYQQKPISYDVLKQQMMTLPADLQNPAVHEFLEASMRLHASTSERLVIHKDFFKYILESIAPIESVLDLACGLNPLNLPWMPVAERFRYAACDIYTDMLDFIGSFFNHFHIEGSAFTCDLTRDVPQGDFQLALLLKTIPCLEQVDKSAGKRLLEGIGAKYILASFPAHSLGGRSKGMVQNYEAHFMQLVEGKPWQVTRFEFHGELAFLVRK